MTQKQNICNQIMQACGEPTVKLGPGSKESRDVLVAAYRHIFATPPPEDSTKIDLLTKCLEKNGENLKTEHHSAGATVTELGLSALLDAVLQHSSSLADLNNTQFIIETNATPYAAQQAIWVGHSKSTADSIKEFIDNSYTAYHDRPETHTHDTINYPTVTITVNYDSNTLSIRDNAGGMAESELYAAIQAGSTASRPNVTGMSGFGVGLKQAATWFVGVAGTWMIETSRLNELYVNIRTLLPTAYGAVSAKYSASSRPRGTTDPALEVGFTQITLNFQNKRALLEKITSESRANIGSLASEDPNIYSPAIRLDLEYTYARLLEGARIPQPGLEGESTTIVDVPQRLSIDWIEIDHGSITTYSLTGPPDPSDDSTAPSHRRVARIPETHSNDYSLTNCYVKNLASGLVEKYWWTCVDIQASAPILSSGPISVRANVRLAENNTLSHYEVGSGPAPAPAVRSVHSNYSRGSRLYYNDRLICVLPAPWLHGAQAGNVLAKSILAEIDIGNLERALHATPGANRLLSSEKNDVNRAGTPYTLMSSVEKQLREHLRSKCILTPNPNSNVPFTSKKLSLLELANTVMKRRESKYPVMGSTQVTNKPAEIIAPLRPVTTTRKTPYKPTVPTSPVGVPDLPTTSSWVRNGTDGNGNRYTLSALHESKGYHFELVVITSNETMHKYKTPIPIEGDNFEDAYMKLGDSLLIAMASTGSLTGLNANNVISLGPLFTYVGKL